MIVRNAIYEYSNIRELLNFCHYNTCLFIDIDDTIATQYLGDKWFGTLMEEACLGRPGKETAELVIAIYHAVQRVTQMQIIEKQIAYIIKTFQDIGIPVIALTSRGIPIIQPTLKQLSDIGIHFDRQWGHNEIKLTIDGKNEISTFKDGIIFCTGSDKGECLSAFLQATNYFPQHVLMIDDKLSHLHAVQKIVLAYGGDFEGIRYAHMDKKNSEFKLHSAQQQLEKLKVTFPEPDQKALDAVNAILSLKSTERFFKPTAQKPIEYISQFSLADMPLKRNNR